MSSNNIPNNKFIPQLKIADMISISGAALSGLGLGAALHEHLSGVIQVFIPLGLIFLGLGMYGKFQIEREHINPPGWVVGIFAVCWMALILAGLFILIGRYVAVA